MANAPSLTLRARLRTDTANGQLVDVPMAPTDDPVREPLTPRDGRVARVLRTRPVPEGDVKAATSFVKSTGKSACILVPIQVV